MRRDENTPRRRRNLRWVLVLGAMFSWTLTPAPAEAGIFDDAKNSVSKEKAKAKKAAEKAKKDAKEAAEKAKKAAEKAKKEAEKAK